VSIIAEKGTLYNYFAYGRVKMTKRNGTKPENITDLDLFWAIRDIPSSILCIKLKSILYAFVALIGNSKKEWYFKSHESLAEIIGIKVRRLPNFLNMLEELNFLLIKRPKNYLKGNTNEYKLNYKKILSTGLKFREQHLGSQNDR
jgi:hypothetical protein